MLSPSTIFLILFITIIGLHFSIAEDCKGCVALDSISFDKVIPKFKTVIVKFDVAFPYGEKHEEYAKVALATKTNYDLLVTEVGVKDYGNKDNSDLAERFNIKKEDFPAVLLFVQGKKKPDRFVAKNDADFNANNIKRFIKSKSGIYLGLPGCIEKLDKLAEEFKNNKEEDKRREILNKVKVFESTLPEAQQEAARFYAKAMQKILDQGDVFIQTEQTRLDGLLKSKSKLPPKKQEWMEERKNILQSFAQRDEL